MSYFVDIDHSERVLLVAVAAREEATRDGERVDRNEAAFGRVRKSRGRDGQGDQTGGRVERGKRWRDKRVASRSRSPLVRLWSQYCHERQEEDTAKCASYAPRIAARAT